MLAKAYYPQLDALRAIAVLLVLFSHFFAGGPWGDYGVRLFFVLSGFLITSIILDLKCGALNLNLPVGRIAISFFVRRSLRLFPIYYLALAIYSAIAVYMQKDIGGVRGDWFYHIAYLTNVLIFFRGEWVGPLSPYWSLGVEEQFYVGWFWLVLLLPWSRMPQVIAACFLGSIVFRLLAYLAGENHYADVLLPACVDTLAAGALLAVATHRCYRNSFLSMRAWLAQRKGLLPAAAWLLALALILCSYGLDKDDLWRRLLTNVLASMLFAYVVYRCRQGVDGRLGRALSMPILVAIGRVSYGIYVYHMLVLYLYQHFLRPLAGGGASAVSSELPLKIVDFLLPFGLTLALAFLSWRFVESPILQLKERYATI